ncbi:MAG: multidrug ABC transporter ATP-binding protein, partial [Bacillota bacterium]|nr:multidrug ABC transporter ATP-binding protein [Bacillota bacterium]
MLKELTKPFQYKRPQFKDVATNQTTKKKVKAKNWQNTIRRLWGYLSEKKGMLILVMAMVIISSGLGLLGPVL